MKKRSIGYFIVFLLLLLSLIVSFLYISSLKNTIYRVRMHNEIQENILQAELSELYETQLQENGFYVSPAIVGDASSGYGYGVVHVYNFFDVPKTFSFSLLPGSSADFPYDSFEVISQFSEVVGSYEEAGILFVLQRTNDDSFPQQGSMIGQYTVQITADGEIIGEDILDVIVVT
ncbi:MAG: hypothetical protein AABX98_03635 [Nanoarchaeota archaeon]